MRLRPLAALVMVACFALALAWWPITPGAVSMGAGSSGHQARADLSGTPLPDETPAAPDGFGPRLLLAGVPSGQRNALSSLSLAVHARVSDAQTSAVPGSPQERYIASGGTASVEQAAAAGLTIEVLDDHTVGRVYYFVDPESVTLETAAAVGTVIYQDPAQILVAFPAAEEKDRLESLLRHGARLARLDPIRLTLDAAEPRAPAMPAISSQADPDVAALLPQVSSDLIHNTIADMSGARSAWIGGQWQNIPTRFHWAGYNQVVQNYLYERYSNLGYSPVRSPWTYGSYSGYNIIADIPGTVHPERIWLIGGHYDSNSDAPYSSAPGADDNASGVAATLAIASALRGQRFSDSIRFVNFSAEELGEWGSKSYAQTLANAGAQVMGYIDLDMIGYDSNADRAMEIHTGTLAGSSTLGSAFTSANARYGQGLTVQIGQGSSDTRFSDHSSFWDHGYSSVLAIEDYFGTVRDRNPWYHNTGDQISRVNLDYVTRIARTSLATIAELAGLIPPTPTITPTPTNTPTITPTPTPIRVCHEMVTDGDFESDTGWQFSTQAEAQAGYTTEEALSGTHSARFGLVAASQVISTPVPPNTITGTLAITCTNGTLSSGYQTISLPAEADDVTLRFSYQPGTTAGPDYFQAVQLLDPIRLEPLADLMRVAENDATWKSQSIRIDDYRGQTVALSFMACTNTAPDSALRTWMYVDDVSVQSCKGPILLPVSYLPLLLTSTVP